MSRKHWIHGLLALALVVAGLGGCASNGGSRGDSAKSANASTALESRAVERWNLLIASKFEEAYQFLSPGVRSTKTAQTYAAELAGRPVRWLTVKYHGKDCASENSCAVTVEVDYEVKLVSAGVGKVQVPGYIVENWIRLNGNWYFVPDDVAQGGLR